MELWGIYNYQKYISEVLSTVKLEGDGQTLANKFDFPIQCLSVKQK